MKSTRLYVMLEHEESSYCCSVLLNAASATGIVTSCQYLFPYRMRIPKPNATLWKKGESLIKIIIKNVNIQFIFHWSTSIPFQRYTITRASWTQTMQKGVFDQIAKAQETDLEEILTRQTQQGHK